MIHENVDISGSLKVSGSFSLPRHASSTDATATTGSMYHDTTDNVAKIYTGTEWVVVGEQAVASSGVSIEYLLVAGGGGAGWDLTAGGGAGGLLSSSLSSVSSGSTFTITIGAGGAGYTTGTVAAANDGDDSTIAGDTISTITAVGGGGGARDGSGRDGGSGGGVGRGNAGVRTPGSGTSGQGNAGGADTNSPAGTGGGGAGAAGGTASGTANPSNGGNGGDGLASSITGTSVTYAGGGGGGGYYGSAGTGGSGGGGNGSGGNAQSNQENGEANKGGGAGGGGQNSPVAASGGSGVAIFAHPTGSISSGGGLRSIANGRLINQFNSSGTLTISAAGVYDKIETVDFFGDSTGIALYTLNGHANDSGGNYNGTASSVTYQEGKITPQSVRFAGSASSKITGMGLPDQTGVFGISLWLYPQNVSATYEEFFSLNGCTINGQSNGQILLNSGTFNWWNSFLVDDSALSNNTWYHLVLTRDSSNNIYYYRDGNLKDSVSSGTGTLNLSDLILGTDTTGENYTGRMAQVRLFSKYLTSDNVTALYNE